jgi:alanine-glyoxylate transaminase/serine-glyoxylate transaminase/serine-pyruvate transaminase
MSLSQGREMLSMPGPSNMPDRVLRAMHRAAPDIYGGPLIDLTETVLRDLRRVAGTEGACAIYIGNGHAVWEASIANILAPGDTALFAVNGRFGHGWAGTARRMGVDVEVMDFGWRGAADPARIEERLAADRDHAIRAVLAVQTDTASSARNDVRALRAALDAAGHPALLAIDCIASIACDRFEMDSWGVDVMIAACQKGLMTPPGVAFTFHGAKAEAAGVACPSPYWDWRPRVHPERFADQFCGTAPTHHLYGLREALDMIAEEGLEAVWERHDIQARAVWAAVEAWGAEDAFALNVAIPEARSRAVTTVRTGPGEATRLRAWCRDEAGVTLGVGMPGPDDDADALFRIGHMGHLNPAMLLGALAAIETGLGALDIAHGSGGVAAAGRVMAGGAPLTPRARLDVDTAAE